MQPKSKSRPNSKSKSAGSLEDDLTRPSRRRRPSGEKTNGQQAHVSPQVVGAAKIATMPARAAVAEASAAVIPATAPVSSSKNDEERASRDSGEQMDNAVSKKRTGQEQAAAAKFEPTASSKLLSEMQTMGVAKTCPGDVLANHRPEGQEAENERGEAKVADPPVQRSVLPSAAVNSAMDATNSLVSLRSYEEEPETSQCRRLQTASSKAVTESEPIGNQRTSVKDYGAVRFALHRLLNKFSLKIALCFFLFIALFGGSIVTIVDAPDDPCLAIADVVMLVIMIVFALEVGSRLYVYRGHYLRSLFCWMDIIGGISMVFEISWMCGQGGQAMKGGSSVDTAMLRSTRAVKLSARLGRLTKTLKVVVSMHMRSWANDDKGGADVERISRQISLSLGTKVALLTVILMLTAPLFDLFVYPEADFSMQVWADRLEVDFKREQDGLLSGALEQGVKEMEDFYSKLSYFPFDMRGFEANNAFVNIPAPKRMENVLEQEVAECLVLREGCQVNAKAIVYFNFRTAKRMEAWCDCFLVVFMIIVMILFAFDLNRTLDTIVLDPLQRMMDVVRTKTAFILEQITNVVEKDEDDDFDDMPDETEIDLLERVLTKLTKLATIFNQNGVVEEAELMELDAEGRGVIVDMLQMGPQREKSQYLSDRTVMSAATKMGREGLVQGLPVDQAVIDSWELDLLKLNPDEMTPLVLYLLNDPHMGRSSGKAFCDEATILCFLEKVRAGYTDQPYHNYIHAVDVLHSVYRFLHLTWSHSWVQDVSHYALLISAMCHDLGHMGRTNQFLVETGHELALRYNDKSPLENLHCATLFAICSQTQSNVFKTLSKARYQVARKVCINTILHTDNVHHFDMVKEISRIYEMSSMLCDLQASDVNTLSSQYCEEILRKHENVFLQLFLHLADVSNPLKPWLTVRPWAMRVLDEFFEQGDEEKQLGIPVGMLNDREKICRPASQHGFIVFLVSPLALVSARLFAPLLPMTQNMVQNLQLWRDLWVDEVRPSSDDVEKKDVDIQNKREEVQQLAERERACTEMIVDCAPIKLGASKPTVMLSRE